MVKIIGKSKQVFWGFALVLSLLAMGCESSNKTNQKLIDGIVSSSDYGKIAIAYPHDKTIFPPELPPPTFRWDDGTKGVNSWQLQIKFKDGSQILKFSTNKTEWMPDSKSWELIKKKTLENSCKLHVVGFGKSEPGKMLSAAQISFSTSRDEVGAPIFYREVNLPFIDAVKDPSRIKWRYGSVGSSGKPKVVLENLTVCGNCHSFTKDGSTMAMDIDYANDKGSYVVADVEKNMVFDNSKIFTWSDYKRDDGQSTFGLLSQISPDGKQVVSTVKDRSVFVPKPDLEYSQLFFPILGVLAVYSRDTKTFQALPGADDPNFVQSNPTWSPDSKNIVFTRAKAHELRRAGNAVLLTQQESDEFLVHHKKFRFDLYRVPFNGGKGGKSKPIPGASHNGMSNYFPKYSPDGKWLVFCKSDSYSLLQPDSKLYIMPAEGGKPRLMNCNTPNMNSWHSWSPNGRWMVFSSKANSPYTQLFLTHVDKNGVDSPPVLLEHFSSPDRAANIPEFVNADEGAIEKIVERFLDDLSYIRIGEQQERYGDTLSAVKAYMQAIELNPKSALAHARLGKMHEQQGRLQVAEEYYLKALEFDPESGHAHLFMGNIRASQKRLEEALSHLKIAVVKMPNDGGSRLLLAQVQTIMGAFPDAEANFEKAYELDPTNILAKTEQGYVCASQGKFDEARKILEQVLEKQPGYLRAQQHLDAIDKVIKTKNDTL